MNCKFESFSIVDANINKLDIRIEIENTLESFSESFIKYFSDLENSDFKCIVNPFIKC